MFRVKLKILPILVFREILTAESAKMRQEFLQHKNRSLIHNVCADLNRSKLNSAKISVICENLSRRVTQMARRAAQMINYEEITLRSLAVLAVILLWILNSL